jgi:TPR repeat protein
VNNIYAGFFSTARPVLLVFFVALAACTENSPEQAFRSGDYARSFELWKPLAERGDLNAKYFVGLHYYFGLGVTKDHNKAREWYEKAAVKGHPAAQLSLGTMHENGDTVPQSFSMAYMWYYASAIQGNEVAPKKMNILYREMKLLPNQIHRAEEMARPYIMNPVIEMNESQVF